MGLGGGPCGQTGHCYMLFPCSTMREGSSSWSEFSRTPVLPDVIVSLECFSQSSEESNLHLWHLRGASVGKNASLSFLLEAVHCLLTWCAPGQFSPSLLTLFLHLILR